MTAWLGFDPTPYTTDEWVAHVMAIDVSKMSWKPQGVMLHATGMPTLEEWVELGPAHDARLQNLQAYYQGMGWQHGPHAFVSRSHINGFSSLLARGTHCSCVNYTHYGIEQAGNFNTGHDDYSTGDGAMVRDCAVIAIAALNKKFGFDPNGLIPHSSCKADGHFQCPGNEVSIPDVIARVKAVMVKL
jgi:hypothetical protein